MTILNDVLFQDGDFVVINGDFVLIHDAESVSQAVLMILHTQIAMNQYAPDSGWNWMHWQGAALSDEDVETIRSQIQGVCETVPYVLRADVSYLGYEDGEFAFNVDLQTTFGPSSVGYAMGGSSVQL